MSARQKKCNRQVFVGIVSSQTHNVFVCGRWKNGKCGHNLQRLVVNGSQAKKKKSENGKRKKVGGVKAVPFILATEVCDRSSNVGFHANLISYLTIKLQLPLVKASNIVSNFDGTASLMTMVGALVADSFAGRYWTIVISCIIYELGLISLTTSAAIKSLNPPGCQNLVNCKEASGFQLGILYLCLLLIAIGLGGARPCVLSFAADQISMGKKSAESRSWNFFSWYYFALGVARLSALNIVVYIQDNISWVCGSSNTNSGHRSCVYLVCRCFSTL
ncbi:hypothetical protein K2173_014990 [Erythroxylum novogranatense]|uniref:Uncharacterized protein n=1 Tax=Erythroxylum novogranatense TaxID=1862640 RepID=A0AAV8TTQ6_9ROSI|nr:hypothetical protein K2173_014990 [Erythroxylum novogranatense]